MPDTDLFPMIVKMSEQLGRIEAKLEQHNKFDDRLKETSRRAEEAFDTATAAKAIATSTQGKVNKMLAALGLGVVGLGFDWLRKQIVG